MTEGEIPAALADRAAQAREQLIEAVAEADEQLMEVFFAEGTLTQEQLVSGLRAATVAGRLFPLVCTSGLHVIGIKGLLDAIVDYVPSPAERDFPALAKDGAETTVKATDSGAPMAFVWKTIADPFAGRITMLRVVSRHVEVGFHGAQPAGGLPRAPRAPAGAAGKNPDARCGIEGRRSRRGRQAEGHADERHPRRQGQQHQVRRDQVSGAGAGLRDRAEEPRRRGQDQQRNAAAARRGSHDRLFARSADPRAAARRARGRCTSRSRSRS